MTATQKYIARGGMSKEAAKAAVRKRDCHRCTKCGMSNSTHKRRYGRSLHVHRIVPGSLYTLEGCVTLCHVCHGPEPVRDTGEPDQDGPSLPRESFHAPQELFDALQRCADESNPPSKKSAVLRAALEHYLRDQGFWPPKS